MARYSENKRREMWEIHRKAAEHLSGLLPANMRDLRTPDVVRQEIDFVLRKWRNIEGFLEKKFFPALKGLKKEERAAIVQRHGLIEQYNGDMSNVGNYLGALRRLGKETETGYDFAQIVKTRLIGKQWGALREPKLGEYRPRKKR